MDEEDRRMSRISIAAAEKQALVQMREFGATVDDDEFFQPKQGYRLNWMAESGLDFETHGLKPLDEKHQQIYKRFEQHFQKMLKEYNYVDKTDEYYKEPDEFTMLRFLQADNYNIPKAITRLLRTLTWRQKSGFEKFVTSPNRAAYKLYSLLRIRQIIGTDKYGRPIMLERTGSFFNNIPAADAMSKELWILCFAYDQAKILQACRESSIKNQKLVHNIVYISCMKRATMWNSRKVFPLVKKMAQETEVYFPELVGAACMVNARKSSEILWSIAKLFINRKVCCFRIFYKMIFIKLLLNES